MKLIRLQQVMEMTGLGRSTIYKYISEEWFPKPVPLGGRSVGWVESEVHAWITARFAARDTHAAAAVLLTCMRESSGPRVGLDDFFLELFFCLTAFFCSGLKEFFLRLLWRDFRYW